MQEVPLGQAPQQVERRYREEHGKLVVEWLRQHFEMGDRGHTILKATVFHDYLVMCRTTGTESTTAAVFGRFVKKAFPTVKCSRKGLDGKSLHCYRCLKRINDDSNSSTTAPSSEESSPRSIEGSGSDSTDDGYDDELRYTIEELTKAAGDALFDTHTSVSQPTSIKTGPSTNSWPPSSASAAYLYNNTNSHNNHLPGNPDSTSVIDMLCAGPEDRSAQPNLNNNMTYYPAQGREYLLPFDPVPHTLPAPSLPIYRSTAVPMRPTATTSFLPLPPFDPLDNYNNSTRQPAYPPTTFSAIPSSTSSFSSRTTSENGTWPASDSDPSLHGIVQSDQDYTMTQVALPRGLTNGLTSYTTSFTTTSTNFTTPSDVLSTKTFYFKPSGRPESSFDTRTKDMGVIGEPWTTSNPTPYPISNGQDFPGRTLTPPFHPVHTTQTCPVHSQPSQFGPVLAASTTGYRPLHMRD